MKILKSLVFTLSLLYASVSSAGLMLWLDPVFQVTSGTGDDVSVMLMAGGLGDKAPLSLSAFDLDIHFDPSVLSFTSYTFFDGLGDLGLFEAEDYSFGEWLAGTIGLAEGSYLTEAELDGVQPGTFALAELFFHVDAMGLGESTTVSVHPLTVPFAFADAAGDSLDVTVTGAAIIGTLGGAGQTVPEPTTIVLMGLGLLALFARRKAF